MAALLRRAYSKRRKYLVFSKIAHQHDHQHTYSSYYNIMWLPSHLDPLPLCSVITCNANGGMVIFDILIDIAIGTDEYDLSTSRAVRYLKRSPRVTV
eukprot:6174410-Pleurochrysis_carterae.AAC.5